MQSHLDSATIDGYLVRTFGETQLRVLDDHVASCLACTLAVESSGLDESRWERRGALGRLVRVSPARAA